MNYADKIFKLIDAEPGKDYAIRLKNGEELKDRIFRVGDDLIIYEQDSDHYMPVPLGLSYILSGAWELVVYQKPLTPEEVQTVIKYARLCGCNWLLADDYGKRKYTFALKDLPKKNKEGKYIIESLEDVHIFIPISLPFLNYDEPYYIGDGDEK